MIRSRFSVLWELVGMEKSPENSREASDAAACCCAGPTGICGARTVPMSSSCPPMPRRGGQSCYGRRLRESIEFAKVFRAHEGVVTIERPMNGPARR